MMMFDPGYHVWNGMFPTPIMMRPVKPTCFSGGICCACLRQGAKVCLSGAFLLAGLTERAF